MNLRVLRGFRVSKIMTTEDAEVHGGKPSFRLPVDLVQHQVNHDTSDRNIQPQRECPGSDRAMPVKALPQGPAQCDDDHGDDERRQDRVRGEDGEVQWPRPSRAAEMHRADVGVVIELGNQEQGRSDQGGEHHGAVRFHTAASDQRASGYEQHGAAAIQRGVDLREDGIVGHRGCLFVRGRAAVWQGHASHELRASSKQISDGAVYRALRTSLAKTRLFGQRPV